MYKRCITLIAVFFIITAGGHNASANGYEDSLKHIKDAQAYIEVMDYKEALKELVWAAEWNDGYGYFGYISYLRGTIYHSLQNHEKASSYFHKALEYKVCEKCKYCEPGYTASKETVWSLLHQIESSEEPSSTKKQTTVDAPKDAQKFLFLGDKDTAHIYGSGDRPYQSLSSTSEFGSEPCDTVGLAKLGYVNDEGRIFKDLDKASVLQKCSIKRGDALYAHGPGWVKKVTLKNFDIRVEEPICTIDLFIDAEIKGLPAAPFFYTNVPNKSLSNGFISAESVEIKQTDLPDNILNYIPQIDEGFKSKSVKGFRYQTDGKTIYLALYSLEGDMNLEGEPLIYDRLYMFDGERTVKIAEGRPSEYCGSETLKLEGYLDFDEDGDMDVVVSSTRAMILLERTSLGFRTYHWGYKACTC